jgi:hypothetical protein
MEWWINDPVRGEDAKWWSIDPQTGEATGNATPADGVYHCLGDPVLDAVDLIAVNVEATFGATRYFSDEETRALLLDRVVPSSVAPHADASAELLENIGDMWVLIDECYQNAWGRPATPIERRWIRSYAFGALKPSSNVPPFP